jgi:hypothetical protein
VQIREVGPHLRVLTFISANLREFSPHFPGFLGLIGVD